MEHDGIYFLNGIQNYYSTNYFGQMGSFDSYQTLSYCPNEQILDLFNELTEYRGEDAIQDCIDDMYDNPADWIIMSHVVYKKKDTLLYGHIALWSPSDDKLKCYEYRYVVEVVPPDNCEMYEFYEIQPKEFKLQSSIKEYIDM